MSQKVKARSTKYLGNTSHILKYKSLHEVTASKIINVFYFLNSIIFQNLEIQIIGIERAKC